jgi:hypothetical protein
VTQRPSSEARKATTAAMSRGSPIRPSAATEAAHSCASFSPRGQPALTSVSTIPGATEFTVIPRGPRILARLRVRLSRAALVAL